MPELPDLEAIKEFLQGEIVGLTITRAEVLRPIAVRNFTGGDFETELSGAAFTAVKRRGKFLILSLDNDRHLVINPMLAGKLYYCPPEERRQARTFLVLGLSNGRELRYVDQKTMGKVYLSGQLDNVPGLAQQGPEPFDADLTLELFRQRLRPFRGEIKGILTRGKLVAGIGNAYADEILFRAGIYPFRKRPSLSAEEVERLYHSMRTVLSEATDMVRQRIGSDIHLKVRDFLKVHGKGGEPCPVCGTTISEIRARQRLTNFCRRCQPGTLIRGQ